MATYSIRPFAPVKRRQDDIFYHRDLAASQTFKEGAVLLVNASNLIAEAGADPTAIGGVATAGAADYAWQDDSFGTVNPSVPVAHASQEFRGTLQGTFAADDIRKTYGLAKDGTTGYWVIDKSETTATRVTVLSADDGVVAGDIDVPVTFKFLPANIQEVA